MVGNCDKRPICTKLANFGVKFVYCGRKIPLFLGKLQKRNIEKVHCKGMIFHGN